MPKNLPKHCSSTHMVSIFRSLSNIGLHIAYCCVWNWAHLSYLKVVNVFPYRHVFMRNLLNKQNARGDHQCERGSRVRVFLDPFLLACRVSHSKLAIPPRFSSPPSLHRSLARRITRFAFPIHAQELHNSSECSSQGLQTSSTSLKTVSDYIGREIGFAKAGGGVGCCCMRPIHESINPSRLPSIVMMYVCVNDVCWCCDVNAGVNMTEVSTPSPQRAGSSKWSMPLKPLR